MKNPQTKNENIVNSTIFRLMSIAITAGVLIAATSCNNNTEIQQPAPVEDSALQEAATIAEARCDSLERLATAIAVVESNMDYEAVNGNCFGPMQITPIMMKEANRLCGFEMFTKEDLFTWSGSLALFGVIMEHYNHSLNIAKACKIWNPKAGAWYYDRVIEAYNEGGN